MAASHILKHTFTLKLEATFIRKGPPRKQSCSRFSIVFNHLEKISNLDFKIFQHIDYFWGKKKVTCATGDNSLFSQSNLSTNFTLHKTNW